MDTPTEADSSKQQASILEAVGSTALGAAMPWPGARTTREGIWAKEAWLRTRARGIGSTVALGADGLPPVRLAKALAVHVRGRRQLNLFKEDAALAEGRLDRLVQCHENGAERASRSDGRGAGTASIG